MTNRSAVFGRLLKAGIGSIANCEGKTAPIVEEDLGRQIGVAANTIQRYKAGYLPPETRTVEILAESCIQRGLMGREWLQRLLAAARYPLIDQLLDKLTPIGLVRPRPPRVYENLPAPTYSQFVMRKAPFAEVLEGLGKRSAAVLIIGLGGNGKTSLAREVAASCLRNDSDAPHFDAAVWISDKDRPGTTNLSTVLDEIARTLDYPGFTQFAFDEKRREVEQLLRRQRVLIVIDNFETITDSALLGWLLNLPEPSKALITTREYRREFRRSSWPVELRGLSDAEALELIQERLAVLRLDQLIVERSQLHPLIAATGGNPKAIGLALGLIKYERRSLTQTLDDLYTARGELFEDLFTRAWSLLDEAARRILLAATFFPQRTDAQELRITADVGGSAFEHAVERLTDLALFDIQQEDLESMPYFSLHPLVRMFALAKLQQEELFHRKARERWAEYIVQRIIDARSEHAFRERAVLEHASATIPAFLDWAYAQQQWELFLRVYKETNILWNIIPVHQPRVDYPLRAVHAAAAIGDEEMRINSLLQLTRLHVYYNDLDAAERYFAQARELYPTVALQGAAHERAASWMEMTTVILYIYTDRITDAYALLQEHLHSDTSQRRKHTRTFYVALCLHKLGRDDEALAILTELFAAPPEQLSSMTTCRICTTLAEIYLSRGSPHLARPVLERNLALAQQMRDRYQIARAELNFARYYARIGDLEAAHTAFAAAGDLFERLGMRRELAVIHAERAASTPPR